MVRSLALCYFQCNITNNSIASTGKKVHFILFQSQYCFNWQYSKLGEKSTIFQVHLILTIMSSMEQTEDDLLKANYSQFSFSFLFSFSTRRLITPVRSNLHKFALSAARDLKLLPFLLRQFCGVNCKVTVCVFAAP